MRDKTMLRLLLLASALLLSFPASADVYKCTDATGQVLYSDEPCAAAVQHERITDKQLESRTTVLKDFVPPTQDQNAATKPAGKKSQPASGIPVSFQEILALFGLVVMIVGGIAFLIEAFRTTLWWGLGCLLFAPVSLVFLILHWQDAKQAFFTQLLGLAVLAAAVYTSDELSVRVLREWHAIAAHWQ